VRFFDAVEKSYQEVFTNRPDLQQKQLNIELSRNLLSQNRAMRLPTISLVGAYQIQAQADNIKFESYRWPKTSFVGLQANIPLFSGNRINSKIRQSTIQLEKSELEYADAKDKTETEIATLENNLKEVFQRLTTQQKTVEAAQMNFNIVNDRYQNGLSSRLELSDAELALTEAKMNQLYSIYNVKIAKLQLDKALGVLQY
jgi:outer membrane protein TolC